VYTLLEYNWNTRRCVREIHNILYYTRVIYSSKFGKPAPLKFYFRVRYIFCFSHEYSTGNSLLVFSNVHILNVRMLGIYCISKPCPSTFCLAIIFFDPIYLYILISTLPKSHIALFVYIYSRFFLHITNKFSVRQWPLSLPVTNSTKLMPNYTSVFVLFYLKNLYRLLGSDVIYGENHNQHNLFGKETKPVSRATI
jgi:hypothetical protein